jgi:DNA-binding MarR family transcriptional regulator
VTIRVTRRTRRILAAIHTLDQPWGLTICRASGLGPGTVYPILERLREAGWIGTRTETAAPDRPPRTVYHLTLQGQTAAGLTPKEQPDA